MYVPLSNWYSTVLMYRVPFGTLMAVDWRTELTNSDQLGVVTRAYFAQRSAHTYCKDLDELTSTETLPRLSYSMISTQVLIVHWTAK